MRIIVAFICVGIHKTDAYINCITVNNAVNCCAMRTTIKSYDSFKLTTLLHDLIVRISKTENKI